MLDPDMWQNVAFILIGLGLIVLIGWSVQGFFLAPDIPLLVKVGGGAIGVGVLVLIAVAIKDRLGKSKTEDFKGVDR